MRTMYIILSWIGWGWLVLVAPVVAVLLHRQRRRERPERPTGGFPVVPIGTEAEVVHEQ